MPRPHAVLLAVAVGAALPGCGSSDDATPDRPRSTRVSQVDESLRAVVAQAPAAAREGVRFVATDRVLSTAFDPARTAMVVLAAPQFPAWDPKSDGVSGARAIAQDRPVLLGRADGPRDATGLPRRARIGHPAAPARTAELTDVLSSVLTDPTARGADGELTRFRDVELPTGPAAVRALLGRDVAAVAVMRSALGEGDDRVRRLRSDATPPSLIVQIGTLRRTPASGRLRRWLISDAGATALREAGFGGPGRYKPRTAPSQLTRTRRLVAALRRPERSSDAFPDGTTIGGITEPRRVGPGPIDGQRFFVAREPERDRACLVTFLPGDANPGGANFAANCTTAASLTRPSGWVRSGDLAVGLVPDGIGCVVVGREATRPARVEVVRNGWALRAGRDGDRPDVGRVRFERGTGC